MDTTPLAGALPIPLTSFIGRTAELELAQSLLQDPGRRLLTLTGPGGIGKTRLAIEIANQLGPSYPDGVTFVPLAAVPHAPMVLPAIGAALGLRALERDTAPGAIAAALGQSARLLVVDNFEHVLEAAPALTRLLAQCPHIKIVATSRSLLRVEGEHAIPVPPLTLPHPAAPLTQDEWLKFPAIQLFVERARAVDPTYAWSETDLAQLIEICSRLDGLPLALELAATRMRHLTLAEIRDRLDERLPLLVDGSRDHPSRLQTMRNAIAWSYDLLAADAQSLFRRISVFAGGFTLEALEAVCAAPHESALLSQPLAQLMDASLLLRERDALGATRYRMLETIREYAVMQLDAAGDAAPARAAHAAYFIGFAERYEFADLMPSSMQAIERFTIERANLQAALAWLSAAPEPDRMRQLLAAHGNFWAATANYHEARSWFEPVLARSDKHVTNHLAKIQVHHGMILLMQGDLEDADGWLTRGSLACQALDEPYYAAWARIGLAAVASLQGNGDQSAAYLHECTLLADQIADRRLAELLRGIVSLNLGVVSRAAGDTERAATQIGDMLHRARTEDYRQGVLIALGDLGDLARDRGAWNDALAYYREALALGRERPSNRVLIEIIESVAMVAARIGQAELATSLLGATARLRERTGLRYQQPESTSSLALALEGLRTQLGAHAYAQAWDLAQEYSTETAIALAIGVSDDARPIRTTLLTARETEIVRLLVRGMTDPEIAAELFISVRTVENHVSHILAKLEVHTRTAAASAAIAAGLTAPQMSTPRPPE